MKAIAYDRYGGPETLEVREMSVPSPGPDDVLVAVHAVSVNVSDVEFLTGRPVYTRASGLTRPKVSVLGSDISGVVEAVGANVSTFRSGDAVYGDALYTWGGFAEFAAVPAACLVAKPAWLSHTAAATLPQAASIALQALRDKAALLPGQKVAINGAGGGAGSFALQFARNVGAEVTGIDHLDKQDFMHEHGADHAIDYELFDYTRVGGPYDLVVDFVASRTMRAVARALSPGGACVIVGGSVPTILQAAALGPLMPLFGGRRFGLLVARTNKYLEEIATMVGDGAIVPVIDRTFALEQTPEAVRLVHEGRARGKVVVEIVPPELPDLT